MQNYIPQNPYTQPNYRPLGYRMVPIASEAEMAGVAVDYSGNPTYFHNQSTNEIYIKYFDIKTGLTPIIKYIREDKMVQPNHEEQQAPRDYVDKMNQLNAKFDTVLALLSKQGQTTEAADNA